MRAYRAADAAGLRRCVVELQDFEGGIDRWAAEGELVADPYIEHLHQKCAAEDGCVFVAHAGNEVCGFVAVQARVRSDGLDEIDHLYAYVSDVVVLNEFRGRGIGRALLQRAERFALERGASVIRIDVLSENRGAMRLYRKLGFRDRLASLEKTLPVGHAER